MKVGRARLVSNYLRLLTTFTSGLLVVRLLAEIGPSSLNIYLIILSGTGFAFFMKIVMQESFVPLLGLSFDGQQDRSFAQSYWIGFLFAIMASLFAVAIFAVLWLLRDHLDIGQLSGGTFSVAVVTGLLRTVASTLATGPLHAILIFGENVRYNVVLAAERLVDVISISAVLVFLGDLTEEGQTTAFFVLSAILYVGVQMWTYGMAKRLDSRFAIRRFSIRKQDLDWTWRIFGWNIAVVVAFLLYLRFSTVTINIAFGESATLIIGLVFLLIGYQRQISVGLVIGLDAMVARLVGGGGSTSHVDENYSFLLIRSIYIQSIFSFASIITLWIFAEPVFSLWLGTGLDTSGWDPALAADLFRIMSIGILARSLSETWMKFLNGRGDVRLYAPWLLLGGISFAFLLVFWVRTNADVEQVLVWIAWAYTILYCLVHFVAVPLALVRGDLKQAIFVIGIAVIPGSVLALCLIALVWSVSGESSQIGTVVWIVGGTALTLLFLAPPVMRRAIAVMERLGTTDGVVR